MCALLATLATLATITNTAAQAVDATAAAAASATQINQLGQLLIPILVPVVIQFLRNKYPDVMSHWWPTLAPLLGILGDTCMHYAGLTNGFHPIAGVALGLTGVGVREVVSKWNTNVINPQQPVPQVQPAPQGQQIPQPNEKHD